MKRTFAAVVLLAALGVMLKLVLKEGGMVATADRPVEVAELAAVDPEFELIARYPADRDLVHRVFGEFRRNALAIERTDGLRGLKLLDALGLEAVYLYEAHPGDFGRLREALTDASAAEILLRWRDYFGLKRADDTDRKVIIDEIARLTPSERRIAARFPNALPLLLTDPSGVVELVDRWSGDPGDLADALALLTFISLEPGTADLRSAIRALDDHGELALDAFRLQGLDGFALVKLYGAVLDDLGRALPLDQALILLRVNAGYVDELLRGHRAETVAGHLRHVAARGLADPVGGSPDALRLVVEFGDRGEQALLRAGPDAADVVFEDFADATLRNQAVEALAEHGPMALAILDKYAADPEFREILRADGPAVIPPIARADSAPEALALLKSKPRWSWSERFAFSVLAVSGDSGQATIRLIKNDGLARVAELDKTDIEFQQFLPLYDLLHLANVARRGHSPTTGELAWAAIDAGFVVADVLSLAAVQPEGVVASEAARGEVRSAVKRTVGSSGREAVEAATIDATRAVARRGATEGIEDAATGSARLARWWAVRSAGSKASLTLSTWGPIRFLKDGEEIVRRIPPSKGLKYLGLQATQAAVGVVGFQKMEEHLASRRPHDTQP
jgi:hypothetical protein